MALWRRNWQYVGGLAAPVLLWLLFVVVLVDTLRTRLRGGAEYDRAALREWVQEARPFRETLPGMAADYLHASSPEERRGHAERLDDQLRVLGDLTKMYQGQMLLFPTIYRLELTFTPPQPDHLAWSSRIPYHFDRVGHEAVVLYDQDGQTATLHIDYLLHAFNKRQRDEQAATTRLRGVSVLAASGTLFAGLWVYRLERRRREHERQRAREQQQVAQAQRRALEEELRRQEAERRHEETERKLLEQRLEAARQEGRAAAAERQALELKSQLYAGIGIMAGSYAHNIKNLLVRPNDLLRRCLEAEGLAPEQTHMLHEVRETLGTVTERLEQILRTVRRDPTRSERTRLDLNEVVRDLRRTWEDLARERWKLLLTVELHTGPDGTPAPLGVDGDLSHLEQAAENLLFNARDATFEMRNYLREQARKSPGSAGPGTPPAEAVRQALIAAAAWKGQVMLRVRRASDRAVLEVQDNGIGMTEEVRRRCTETHFSTKRDNALYEGHSTGMGLGLSFVVAIVEAHGGGLEVVSAPLEGTTFRLSLPLAAEREAVPPGRNG